MPTKETWEFINTFAPWFSAFGTISAVVVSLYLATKDRKVRLQVSAGHRLIVSPGMKAPYPEYLGIYVVNKGHREAQVTGFGWKVGVFMKRVAEQVPEANGLSSPLPVRLKDGEEAKFLFPLNEEFNWIDHFIETLLQPFPSIRIHFVKVFIYTSIGKIFEAKIEKGLKDKIIERIKERP